MSEKREHLQTLFLFLTVAALHVPFLMLFCIHKSPLSLPNKKEPLKVMTRIMQEATIEKGQEPSKEVTTVTLEKIPLPAISTPEKKRAEKKIQEKKIQEKKKEADKTPVINKDPMSQKSKNNKEILALLENSLQKTQTGSSVVENKETKEIALQSEHISSVPRFEEELVIYLQQQLSIPYPGKVSLLLTLNAEGKLLELKIKECKESENRLYLEQALYKLIYPSFVSYFPKEKSHIFSLTFYIK